MKKTVTMLLLLTIAAITAILLAHGRCNGTLQPENTGTPVTGNYSISNEHSPPSVVTADMILIEKRLRLMTLFRKGNLLKRYHIALGSEPVGKKTTEGDCRTPEGIYIIDRRNIDSKYYHSLHISYPNEEDKRQAAARKVSPGGDIMIHGLKNGWGRTGKPHLMKDWTLGCIALTNREIDEIWRMVPDGTPVEIVP
jgi:murein L,D-transpeptidase YafK